MAAGWDRDAAASGPVVQAISARGFTIDGGVYEGLFLTPRSAHEWRPPPLADLSLAEIEPLLGIDPAPEFLLLGTGPTMTFPPRTLVRALDERGIGIEAMDSRAAARTWGMLRAEERWIAAAIMPL